MQDALQKFYKAGLVVTNSLSFCSPRKHFIPASLLKNSFTGYNILGWTLLFFFFFSFKTLNVSSHSWSYRVSAEKSDNINLTSFHLFVTWHFFLMVFRILSLFLTFDNVTTGHLGEDLFQFSLLGVLWAYSMWMSMSLSRPRKFSTIISFSRSSCFFPFLFFQEYL